jgi:DNA (cytosine-5)-methyltransferase 1
LQTTENKLKVLDLFSGIGGFSLGLQRAGMTTVQFVEIDPFCQKVLNKHFPGVPIHDDIKTFTYTGCFGQEISEKQTTGVEQCDEVATIDLICGGFPCQPYSCAGKRRGKEDDRALWPEMLRVIKEVKPRWVIGENVAGIFSILEPDSVSELEIKEIELFCKDETYAVTKTIQRVQRRVVGQIIKDLEQIGYDFPRLADGTPIILCVPACAVNAPHRRDRVWIIACNSAGNGRFRGRESLTTQERLQPRPESTGELERRLERSDCHAADTEGINVECSLREGNNGRRPERKIGNESWSENWLEVATRLCRVDDGVPRKLDRVNRLKALGNAVVPQIVEIIGKAIMEVESL